MLRRHIKILRHFLPKPMVHYSTTAISSKKESKPNLVKMLEKEFNHVQPVLRTLKKAEVKNIHFNEWKDRINLMKRFHFSDFECFQMISRYPLLLKIPLSEMENTLRKWFYADLGINNFHQLMLNQPALLEINEEDINFRVPNLRVNFRSTTALFELLLTCPVVMFDPWESVLAKLDYLIKEKGFKMGDVLQGNALSKPLPFIKFRLDLSEKCGVYKPERDPIHKFNKYDRTKHKNPTLKQMLLENPSEFVKTARISVEECKVYEDLFMSQENERDDDDDDDDDED